MFFKYFIRTVKQNFLSNDSHPNYFDIISFLLEKFIHNCLCNVVRRQEGFA